MNDSSERDALAATHDRNREHRINAVKRWVEYITENPAEKWSEQLNRLENAQIASARASGLATDHRRRIEEAGRGSRRTDGE